MTIAFTARTVVPAPPETVWATLTDWARAPEWMPEVASMRADGPLQVGTVLHFTAQGAGRTSVVSALEAGRAITLTSERPGVRADYRYELVPGGAGTSIALVADVATSGVMRMLGPVIRSAVAKADNIQLERLAALF
jgi:Uncharacterized conserved protein